MNDISQTPYNPFRTNLDYSDIKFSDFSDVQYIKTHDTNEEALEQHEDDVQPSKAALTEDPTAKTAASSSSQEAERERKPSSAEKSRRRKGKEKIKDKHKDEPKDTIAAVTKSEQHKKPGTTSGKRDKKGRKKEKEKQKKPDNSNSTPLKPVAGFGTKANAQDTQPQPAEIARSDHGEANTDRHNPTTEAITAPEVNAEFPPASVETHVQVASESKDDGAPEIAACAESNPITVGEPEPAADMHHKATSEPPMQRHGEIQEEKAGHVEQSPPGEVAAGEQVAASIIPDPVLEGTSAEEHDAEERAAEPTAEELATTESSAVGVNLPDGKQNEGLSAKDSAKEADSAKEPVIEEGGVSAEIEPKPKPEPAANHAPDTKVEAPKKTRSEDNAAQEPTNKDSIKKTDDKASKSAEPEIAIEERDTTRASISETPAVSDPHEPTFSDASFKETDSTDNTPREDRSLKEPASKERLLAGPIEEVASVTVSKNDSTSQPQADEENPVGIGIQEPSTKDESLTDAATAPQEFVDAAVTDIVAEEGNSKKPALEMTEVREFGKKAAGEAGLGAVEESLVAEPTFAQAASEITQGLVSGESAAEEAGAASESGVGAPSDDSAQRPADLIAVEATSAARTASEVIKSEKPAEKVTPATQAAEDSPAVEGGSEAQLSTEMTPSETDNDATEQLDDPSSEQTQAAEPADDARADRKTAVEGEQEIGLVHGAPSEGDASLSNPNRTDLTSESNAQSRDVPVLSQSLPDAIEDFTAEEMNTEVASDDKEIPAVPASVCQTKEIESPETSSETNGSAGENDKAGPTGCTESRKIADSTPSMEPRPHVSQGACILDEMLNTPARESQVDAESAPGRPQAEPAFMTTKRDNGLEEKAVETGPPTVTPISIVTAAAGPGPEAVPKTELPPEAVFEETSADQVQAEKPEIERLIAPRESSATEDTMEASLHESKAAESLAESLGEFLVGSMENGQPPDERGKIEEASTTNEEVDHVQTEIEESPAKKSQELVTTHEQIGTDAEGARETAEVTAVPAEELKDDTSVNVLAEDPEALLQPPQESQVDESAESSEKASTSEQVATNPMDATTTDEEMPDLNPAASHDDPERVDAASEHVPIATTDKGSSTPIADATDGEVVGASGILEASNQEPDIAVVQNVDECPITDQSTESIGTEVRGAEIHGAEKEHADLQPQTDENAPVTVVNVGAVANVTTEEETTCHSESGDALANAAHPDDDTSSAPSATEEDKLESSAARVSKVNESAPIESRAMAVESATLNAEPGAETQPAEAEQPAATQETGVAEERGEDELASVKSQAQAVEPATSDAEPQTTDAEPPAESASCAETTQEILELKNDRPEAIEEAVIATGFTRETAGAKTPINESAAVTAAATADGTVASDGEADASESDEVNQPDHQIVDVSPENVAGNLAVTGEEAQEERAATQMDDTTILESQSPYVSVHTANIHNKGPANGNDDTNTAAESAATATELEAAGAITEDSAGTGTGHDETFSEKNTYSTTAFNPSEKEPVTDVSERAGVETSETPAVAQSDVRELSDEATEDRDDDLIAAECRSQDVAVACADDTASIKCQDGAKEAETGETENETLAPVRMAETTKTDTETKGPVPGDPASMLSLEVAEKTDLASEKATGELYDVGQQAAADGTPGAAADNDMQGRPEVSGETVGEPTIEIREDPGLADGPTPTETVPDDQATAEMIPDDRVEDDGTEDLEHGPLSVSEPGAEESTAQGASSPAHVEIQETEASEEPEEKASAGATVAVAASPDSPTQADGEPRLIGTDDTEAHSGSNELSEKDVPQQKPAAAVSEEAIEEETAEAAEAASAQEAQIGETETQPADSEVPLQQPAGEEPSSRDPDAHDSQIEPEKQGTAPAAEKLQGAPSPVEDERTDHIGDGDEAKEAAPITTEAGSPRDAGTAAFAAGALGAGGVGVTLAAAHIPKERPGAAEEVANADVPAGVKQIEEERSKDIVGPISREERVKVTPKSAKGEALFHFNDTPGGISDCSQDTISKEEEDNNFGIGESQKEEELDPAWTHSHEGSGEQVEQAEQAERRLEDHQGAAVAFPPVSDDGYGPGTVMEEDASCAYADMLDSTTRLQEQVFLSKAESDESDEKLSAIGSRLSSTSEEAAEACLAQTGSADTMLAVAVPVLTTDGDGIASISGKDETARSRTTELAPIRPLLERAVHVAARSSTAQYDDSASPVKELVSKFECLGRKKSLETAAPRGPRAKRVSCHLDKMPVIDGAVEQDVKLKRSGAQEQVAMDAEGAKRDAARVKGQQEQLIRHAARVESAEVSVSTDQPENAITRDEEMLARCWAGVVAEVEAKNAAPAAPEMDTSQPSGAEEAANESTSETKLASVPSEEDQRDHEFSPQQEGREHAFAPEAEAFVAERTAKTPKEQLLAATPCSEPVATIDHEHRGEEADARADFGITTFDAESSHAGYGHILSDADDAPSDTRPPSSEPIEKPPTLSTVNAAAATGVSQSSFSRAEATSDQSCEKCALSASIDKELFSSTTKGEQGEHGEHSTGSENDGVDAARKEASNDESNLAESGGAVARVGDAGANFEGQELHEPADGWTMPLASSNGETRPSTPAIVVPDEALIEEDRAKSLRRKQRLLVRDIEDTIAAATVIYAAAQAFCSRPNSMIQESDEGFPFFVSVKGLEGDSNQLDADLSLEETSTGSRTVVGDADRERSHRRRHSHHSNRHSSHRDDDEGRERRRRLSHGSGASHSRRHRSDGLEDAASTTLPPTPQTPQTPHRRDSGFAGESSERSGKRRSRTGEDMVDHERQKVQRHPVEQGHERRRRSHHSRRDHHEHKDRSERSSHQDRRGKGTDHSPQRSHHRSLRRHSHSSQQPERVRTASTSFSGEPLSRQQTDLSAASPQNPGDAAGDTSAKDGKSDRPRRSNTNRSKYSSHEESNDRTRQRGARQQDPVEAPPQPSSPKSSEVPPENSARRARQSKRRRENRESRQSREEVKKTSGIKGIFRKLFKQS